MTSLPDRIQKLERRLPTLSPPDGVRMQDAKAGRLHVRFAHVWLAAARDALSSGDEAAAAGYVMDAQGAFIQALEAQLPRGRRERLASYPDIGGRPPQAALDAKLYLAAEEQAGGIAERCKAALTHDKDLNAVFGTVSKSALRKAHKRGADELKRE